MWSFQYVAGSIRNDTFRIYTTLYWTLGLLAFPAGMRFPYSGGGIVEWIENQGDMACFQQNWIRILKEEDRSDFAFLLWNKNLSMADYCSFMLLLLHPQCLKGEKVLKKKTQLCIKQCTQGPWLLRILVVQFSLVRIFKKIPEYPVNAIFTT